MPNLPTPYILSSADVVMLRASMRGHRHDIGGIGTHVNWTREGQYTLWHGGNVVAASADERPLLALLRGERLEPGFIAAVLSPALTCDEALLDVEARALTMARRRASEARARREAEDRDDARREAQRALQRRAASSQEDYSALDLDALLSMPEPFL